MLQYSFPNILLVHIIKTSRNCMAHVPLKDEAHNGQKNGGEYLGATVHHQTFAEGFAAFCCSLSITVTFLKAAGSPKHIIVKWPVK